MSHLLPPNLLRLFAPRPQPPFLKPLSKDERVRGPNKLAGVAPLFHRLKEEADEEEIRLGMVETEQAAKSEQESEIKAETSKRNGHGTNGNAEEDGELNEKDQPITTKSKGKKKDIIAEKGIIGPEAVKMRNEMRKKRQEEYKKNIEKNYKPQDDPNAVGDPYKTLFISRLSKKATEVDLRREFEMYGAIERIRIIKDRKGKSKSYAFIVYERERDMKAAYKDAEGIPIHHKKILVDVERGRTVKGWKPRKLGGGLGGRPKPVDPAKEAPAPPMPAFGGGGFRGGFGGRGGGGGGFRGGPPRGGFGGGGGGFGGRGGFQGGRGGFQGGGGGFQGGGGGFGGSGGRGGFQGGGGGGGFQGGGGSGGGYGGPPSGGGGFQNGFNQSGPPGGGYGGGQGGFKRDFDNSGGAGGGYSSGGGGGGGGGGGFGGGYEDRDPKRMRY
ncbi:uncharacterized protein I206_104330 [Kwoniella pini CBS 10737]|uniref:U1 small nuclear ribonucleoprotein 70 kDa n=1 Tax=Kwoniella pini CBS 10737 TaxID=1296096 RepID=A0A1B9I1Z2_9TREE|nr:U1 small nuclear ribonucleoprotein 70kDa [Kwoniella pini CBS 10737]OCF49570.1 U1 small nuclear ribonucleoprotein 70kDa [Kwoniella pini CBS 10737]